MKKNLIISLFLLFTAQFAFGGKMEEFTLKNNIKVIFDKTEGADVVSVKVFTPAAVICEKREKAGVSCMASNLAVKSTKNRDSQTLAADIDNIGASLSASTEYDTQYFTINVLSEYFDKAAELLADAVKNPAFDEKEIEAEKKTMIAALNARKDRILETASDNFIMNFYGKNPYALNPLGTPETLNSVTRDDLIKRHAECFNASNILISISGNVDKKTVKNSLEKYFGDIEAGEKFQAVKFESMDSQRRCMDIKGKFNQAYIMTGFAAPDLKDKDFVSLKLACSVLGGRMTSRLFTELREKLGLAYEVSAVYPSRVCESFFVIYIGLDKKNIDLTLKRIDEILKDFYENGVSETELRDTKNYMKGIYVMDRQTVGKKSYYYGWRETVGHGYAYDDKYIEDIEKVTPEDIKKVAEKIFTQNPLTVIIRPDEK